MYPKTLSKEEMILWIEKSRLPMLMCVTQVSEDTIILQRLNERRAEELKLLSQLEEFVSIPGTIAKRDLLEWIKEKKDVGN